MTGKRFSFKFSDLDIGPEHIFRILGKEAGEGAAVIESIVEEVLTEAASVADVKAEYLIYDGVSFDSTDFSMEVEGNKFTIGKIISGQVKKSSGIAFFNCTAGGRIGDMASELIKGSDYLKGYILDIAGSETVEAAADLMQSELKSEMLQHGMGITNRFSPGYCGWRLIEQHKLFSLMPANYSGITLNGSALMTPRKSVSGIIGIGKDLKMLPYTCSLCDDDKCIYRRKNT
jgi:hypothetical protein